MLNEESKAKHEFVLTSIFISIKIRMKKKFRLSFSGPNKIDFPFRFCCLDWHENEKQFCHGIVGFIMSVITSQS